MSFNDYYRHYLSLHQTKACRRLHLLGLATAIAAVALVMLFTPYWWLCFIVPAVAYPFAWAGHFCFERNTPAVWKNPIFANLSDFRMTWDILRGKLEF